MTVNRPNDHKNYHHLSFQDNPKFTKIGTFGLKIYHLATLLPDTIFTALNLFVGFLTIEYIFSNSWKNYPAKNVQILVSLIWSTYFTSFLEKHLTQTVCKNLVFQRCVRNVLWRAFGQESRLKPYFMTSCLQERKERKLGPWTKRLSKERNIEKSI
jgi:hypothetical protein